MLHACVQRFDVMENLEKFYKILGIDLFGDREGSEQDTTINQDAMFLIV